MRRAVWAGICLLVVTATAAGQVSRPPQAALLAQPAVKAAISAARQNEPRTLEDQVEVCEVPAPPFGESARAVVLKRKFEAAGLRDVHIDAAGNVVGERPGSGPRPHLVLAAHLDTVFPEGTDVRTKREGLVIRGPGIGDDCRGLAVLVSVARALDAGGVKTDGPITFVANVGEEGLGDLRGVKYLFSESTKGAIDRFVSFDGTGFGVTNVAVGSFRYRVTFKGPGGHSFGAFGLVNPIHALGRAIAKIDELRVPDTPRVTFNVGRIGGGTSINSIAQEAWFEMDMRSSDPKALGRIDADFKAAVDQAAAEENQRWSTGTVTATRELVGVRPAGRTPPDAPIVRTAIDVTTALGETAPLGEGSTDSNIPISLGIPAITVGAGGLGTGTHSLSEAFDTTNSWKGTQRAVLLAVALSTK